MLKGDFREFHGVSGVSGSLKGMTGYMRKLRGSLMRFRWSQEDSERFQIIS